MTATDKGQRTPARQGRRDPSNGQRTNNKGQRPAKAGAMTATDNEQRTKDDRPPGPARSQQRTTDKAQRTNNKGHRPARAGAIRATENGKRTDDNGKPKTENRKPKTKKWRSLVGLADRWRLAAAGVHRRKLWELSGFRSRARRPAARRNGALALGKAPFSATFGPFFGEILRVFSASSPKRLQMGANLTPKALVLNQA
jgi:hypothetical protein